MNERINNLAEQCYEEILGVKVFNKEKFAELIVRECVSLFPAEYDTVESKTTIGKIIKNHFGVE